MPTFPAMTDQQLVSAIGRWSYGRTRTILTLYRLALIEARRRGM